MRKMDLTILNPSTGEFIDINVDNTITINEIIDYLIECGVATSDTLLITPNMSAC